MMMIRSNTDQPHLLRWKWIIAPFWTVRERRERERWLLPLRCGDAPCRGSRCVKTGRYFLWLMRDVHYDYERCEVAGAASCPVGDGDTSCPRHGFCRGRVHPISACVVKYYV